MLACQWLGSQSVRSIIMSHQWLLQEQGQVKAIDSCGLSNKKLVSQWLVVSCHERKLAEHVKGVREKKIKRCKERTFHSLSSSITSTLAFHSCITLSPNTRSKINEKYKEEEEELI